MDGSSTYCGDETTGIFIILSCWIETEFLPGIISFEPGEEVYTWARSLLNHVITY